MDCVRLLKKMVYDGASQDEIDLAEKVCELYMPLQKLDKGEGSAEKVNCYTVEAIVKKMAKK